MEGHDSTTMGEGPEEGVGKPEEEEEEDSSDSEFACQQRKSSRPSYLQARHLS